MNNLLKVISIAAVLGFLSACEPLTTWRTCLTPNCNWPYNNAVYVRQPVSTGPYYRACECARERRVVQGLDGAMMYHD